MTEKEILHQLILSMNPYKHYGVPRRIYNLVLKLAKKVYGDECLEFLIDSGQISMMNHRSYYSLQNIITDKELLPRDIIRILENGTYKEYIYNE